MSTTTLTITTTETDLAALIKGHLFAVAPELAAHIAERMTRDLVNRADTKRDALLSVEARA